MTEHVLVPIAPGSEEIEAVTIIDVLRRAGIHVTVASCCPDRLLHVTASRGVKLVADSLIEDVAKQHFDLIALPGGMPGADHLAANEYLSAMLRWQQAQGRWYGAICAAPAVVLEPQGLIGEAEATCHPAFIERLPAQQRRDDLRVVIDEQAKLVTSQGPGTAIEFALALVKVLLGEEKAAEVGKPMVLG